MGETKTIDTYLLNLRHNVKRKKKRFQSMHQEIHNSQKKNDIVRLQMYKILFSMLTKYTDNQFFFLSKLVHHEDVLQVEYL